MCIVINLISVSPPESLFTAITSVIAVFPFPNTLLSKTFLKPGILHNTKKKNSYLSE